MNLNKALTNPKFIFGAIIIIVFVLYGKSLSFENTLDDDLMVTHPYVLQGVSATGKIFSTGFLKAIKGVSVSYRPLSTFTFAVEQSLHNGHPALRRFLNLMLYACCGLLIWLLSKSWFPKQKSWFHALLAFLFIAHPIHTEVVSNLKSRDEILTLLLFLSSLYCIDLHISQKKKHTVELGVFLFFLSLLSKENAVGFIIIIPLTLYVFYQLPLKKFFNIMAPFVLPILVYFTLRYLILDDVSETGVTQILNNSMVEANGWADRLSSSSYLLLLYFQKLLLPINLCWDYGYSTITYIPFSSGEGIFYVLAAFALGLLGIYLLYRKSIYGWAIISIIISLGLVLNFLVLIGANFAERFLFTPSLFFVVALALAFDRGLIDRKYQMFTKVVVIGVMVFYSFKTFTRNLEWKNSETLFLSALETHPESSRVQMAVGSTYRAKAEKMPPSPQQEQVYKQALQHYDQAIKILDRNFEAWYNKGVIYQSTGGTKLAKECFEKVIKIDPAYIGALNNLGFINFNEKKYDKALEYFHKADSIQPNNAQVLGNLASSYHNLRKYDLAREYYEKSLAANPNQPDVRANYGKLPKE